ncbi:MAG: hypothetical protein JHC33_01305 [Ignisphaera sp.]|nr:hypothetical protein [Ignisphaera sp.]
MNAIRLIHIAPTSLIKLVDEHYNKGLNMVLTHLVLSDPEYAKVCAELDGIKYLDNSFFELGYCSSPKEMLDAAFKVNATLLICPDGTKDGLNEFKAEGYKVMCIPKNQQQFCEFMLDKDIDMVGVSEEHLDYRHSPGARYELFRDNISSDMPKKKIHLLGATDSCWELGMLSPYSDWIYSWDSSAAIWQGFCGELLTTQPRKNCLPVNFEEPIKHINLFMQENITFLERLVR